MAIKAYLFDVFGTCVDWRSSVEKALTQEASNKGLDMSHEMVSSMATAWREGYSAYNARAASNRSPEFKHEKIDVVHRRVLQQLIEDRGYSEVWSSADLDALNLIWHKLAPWSDTTEGLRQLKRKAIVGTLSNGNMRLLVDMAKHSDLDWDILLSSELFKSAKPNPSVYLGACSMVSHFSAFYLVLTAKA